MMGQPLVNALFWPPWVGCPVCCCPALPAVLCSHLNLRPLARLAILAAVTHCPDVRVIVTMEDQKLRLEYQIQTAPVHLEIGCLHAEDCCAHLLLIQRLKQHQLS